MLYLVVVASQQCDQGWVKSPFESCYKFVTSKKANWAQASGFCADMKGHLVTLDSMDEIIWMKGFRSHNPSLRKQRFWIGGYKKDGIWMWKGDLADSPMLVSDWAVGEPNMDGGKQECLQLFGEESSDGTPDSHWYRFDDESCGIAREFICEKTY